MKALLRILVDECTSAKSLVGMLRAAGFDVVTSAEALGIGASDADIFAYAQSDQRVILTHNCADFNALHEEHPGHYGVLLIYEDRDSRDLTYRQIVAAIHRVDREPDKPIGGRAIVLNHLR